MIIPHCPLFPLKTMYVNGIYFPVESEEEAELIREETEGKDIRETLIVLGDWLRACATPDPTDDLASVVEG